MLSSGGVHAGAAIILRTDVQLRLQTNRSVLGQDQTNFATAVRSLLSPYQFMSVAVSGFQVSPSFLRRIVKTTPRLRGWDGSFATRNGGFRGTLYLSRRGRLNLSMSICHLSILLVFACKRHLV